MYSSTFFPMETFCLKIIHELTKFRELQFLISVNTKKVDKKACIYSVTFLKTIIIFSQIPVTKLFFFDKDEGRLVFICVHFDLRAACVVSIKPERRRYSHISSMDIAELVSHREMSSLNSRQPSNACDKSVTRDTFLSQPQRRREQRG